VGDVGQDHLVRDVGQEIPVLADELGQHDLLILAHPVIDQGVVEDFLGCRGPPHEPALIPCGHGVGVFRTEIPGGVKGPVGNRHLQGIPSACRRAVNLKGVGDAHAGATGVGACTRRRGPENDRNLGVLAFTVDELGIELPVGDHPGELHHDGRIGPYRVGADDLHFREFRTLSCRGAAAEH